MNRALLILLLFLQVGSSNVSLSQKYTPFTGMLEYKITIRDTSLRSVIEDNQMFLYTNDTISRMENFTPQLGKQVVIRHMGLLKSYMLIDTDKGKFAIKVDESDKDTVVTESKYQFKKKCFKRKILGYKAKRLEVTHPAFDEPIEFLYLKNRSNKYLNNFEQSPGLLVKYSVVSVDGIYDYELVKISEFAPNRDLFGIPSDYQKVTINEFMDYMTGVKQIPNSNPPEDN